MEFGTPHAERPVHLILQQNFAKLLYSEHGTTSY